MKQILRTGLSWGVIMFIMMTFVFPWFQKEEITTRSIIVGIIVWTICGVIFGFIIEKGLKK